MEKWLAESIQIERNQIKELINRETMDQNCGTDDGIYDELINAPEIQEQLGLFNVKLQRGLMYRSGDNVNKKDTTDSAMGMDEIDEPMPGSSFDITEQLINELLERVCSLEDQITQCYNILGHADGNTSLASLLRNYTVEQRNREREYNDMVKKNEKLLHDLYDYSKKCCKLREENNETITELGKNEKEIERLREENQDLIIKLEDQRETNLRIHRQQLEKEKTLLDLKAIMETLQSSQEKMVEENELLRNKQTIRSPRTTSPLYLQPLKHAPMQRNLSISSSSQVLRKIGGKKTGPKRKKLPNYADHKHH